jgi:Rieske 2Fe-2S family protein
MRTPMTLPATYYADADHFRREMERFFFGAWVHVGREEQIAKPGDYLLVDLLGESVIVTRNEAGKPRAFYNLCRHRGTRLCDKATGHFKGGKITCPYHAWTYGLDGALLGAAHMDETPGFSKDKFPLRAVAADTWDGHLFLNFSEKPVALREQLAGVWEKFRPWRMEELKLGKRVTYELKANWKLIIQNYSECLHCPVIHPTLKKLSHYMTGDNEAPRNDYLGGHMTLNEGVASMTVSGATKRPLFRHLSDDEKRRVYYYWLNPNLLLSLHPDYMMTHTLWPKAHDRTDVVCEFHFHPEAMAREDFTADDAFEFWDQVNREDWHVSELSQLGIASRGYTPGPYSHRESLLHGLDLVVTGELPA